jgi:hypothetical protein
VRCAGSDTICHSSSRGEEMVRERLMARSDYSSS